MKNNVTLYQHSTPKTYSKLQEYDFSEFSGKQYQAVNAHFNSEQFEFLRFKSGRYSQCIFNNCTFKVAGLSGTHFLTCHLKDFEIADSNLQFCDFSQNCILEGNTKTAFIYSSNLSQSMFHDTELRNISFRSTTISQARFIDTTFKNVVWESCTLQDNIFNNIVMDNISLVGCNLEYSDFKNVKMKNVKLPFHQLPYTFGLLQCLNDYSDEIMIDAVSSKHEAIKPQEYISLLPDLLSYYIDMNEYFPAINIALFCEDYEKTNSLINEGIKYYIQANDFRKIKGMCRLIADNPYYDKHYMTQLYLKLVEYYNMISVSEYEKYQYSLHINDIKHILTGFDNTTLPVAQLYLKTNITSADIDKVGVFHRLIEQCLGDFGISNEEYSVEIRHNSDPLSFWITLSQDDSKLILHAVGMLMSVITANPAFLQSALDVIGNMTTIASFALQIGQAFSSPKKTATSEFQNVAVRDVQYIKAQNHILEDKKIAIDVTLPFFNFSYHVEKRHENQN